MAIVQFVAPGESASREKAQAEFEKRLSKIKTNLDSKLGNPTTLATEVQELIAGKKGQGGVSLLGGLKALRRVIKFGLKVKKVATTTAQRVQELRNSDAIESLIIGTAVVEMARVSKDLGFESVQEAAKIRDEVSDLILEQSEKTTDDALFQSYIDLRTGVVKDINRRTPGLARIQTKQPSVFSNALVMAYDLYEDSTRDQEIADRNGLAMPGFIPPGQDVQVLNI